MSNEERVKGLVEKVKEEQAFPSSFPTDTLGFVQEMSKREYFAAMAMQGMIAASPWSDGISVCTFASNAVLMADALIAELKK